MAPPETHACLSRVPVVQAPCEYMPHPLTHTQGDGSGDRSLCDTIGPHAASIRLLEELGLIRAWEDRLRCETMTNIEILRPHDFHINCPYRLIVPIQSPTLPQPPLPYVSVHEAPRCIFDEGEADLPFEATRNYERHLHDGEVARITMSRSLPPVFGTIHTY